MHGVAVDLEPERSATGNRKSLSDLTYLNYLHEVKYVERSGNNLIPPVLLTFHWDKHGIISKMYYDVNSDPFGEMSGVFQESYTRTCNGNGVDGRNSNQSGAGSSKKRKLDETMDTPGEGLLVRGRSFLPVRGGCDVFATEDWKATGTSLFCPVKHDVYVNLHKYDQITAAQGSFFTADEGGNFENSVTGHVIHLWRYDKVQRKQYISQSFLFTNQQEFLRVQTFLQNI